MKIEPFTNGAGELGFTIKAENQAERALLVNFVAYRPGKRLSIYSSSYDNGGGCAGFAFGHVDEKSVAPTPLWRRLLPARWRLA